MVVNRPYGRENDGYNRPYDGNNRPDDGYNRPNGYRPTNYDGYGREDGYSKEGAYRTFGIRVDSIPFRDYTNIMKNGFKNTIISWVRIWEREIKRNRKRNLWLSNPYILQPIVIDLRIQTNNLSLNCQRLMFMGCKYKEIRKFEFVARTQILCIKYELLLLTWIVCSNYYFILNLRLYS